MTDPHQLIIDLLLFCLKLHLIGERLPFTAAAYSEMLAEWLQTMFGRLFDFCHEAFHKTGTFLRDAYIDYVSGNCKRYEYHNAVRAVGDCLSFGCDVFNGDVGKYEVDPAVSHRRANILKFTEGDTMIYLT